MLFQRLLSGRHCFQHTKSTLSKRNVLCCLTYFIVYEMDNVNNMDELKEHYTYNNIVYSVVAARDVHKQLQNNSKFFNTYFAQTVSSHEAISVSNEGNDSKVVNFSWTRENTKLFLDYYFERKDKLRDPKIKKHYEDKTINIGASLSSMASSDKERNVEQCIPSQHCSISNSEKRMTMSSICSDIEIAQDVTDSAFSACQTVPSFPINDPVPDVDDVSGPKSKKLKCARTKASYDLRKQQLECEQKRVDAINELKDVVNEHNRIQRERNEILRELIESNKNKSN
ncbi:PREDICTED: uncharacterized protein LOC105571133 [Vollenhovia emeryi]|uniref:uncharacterized protein LOC105571133 n=1 Tax=Vollenhovia emeryi TaxID=411798 RepID=UPI0005F3F4C5|nr:PREDICTED: uncharacterized protein LOC105571133 [Vollenhovia emeryi]